MIAGIVASAVPALAVSPIPVSGLVAYYSMDSVSGSTLIDSAAGRNGQITGAAQVPGYRGQALSFNGTSTFVEVDALWSAFPSGSAPFTVSAWLNHASLTGQRDVIDLGLFATGGFRLLLVDSSVYAQLMRVASTTSVIAAAPALNAWYQALMEYDGTTLRLYLNNVLVGTANAAWVRPASGLVRLGCEVVDGNTNAAFYAGLLDNVRIYNRVLTDVERGHLYAE
jgi:hypothetical protein